MTTNVQSVNVSPLPLHGIVDLGALINRIDHYIDPRLSVFISRYSGLNDKSTKILNSTDFNFVRSVFKDSTLSSIINLAKINDAPRINKFFEAVNEKLENNGIFIGCFESSEQRKERILKKYPKFYSYPFYVGTFILKRVFPKWVLTKKIYFFLTKGKNRYLSLAETLGRLVSCGFEILEYENINNLTYFSVKKVKKPSYDLHPSYGILIKLKRIGKNGKPIKVYKLRTMHPYAEYLQSYVYKKNSLQKGGKFNNDFRVTTWGRFLRKYWIDELPMLLNLFKGELKIIGVRPLSMHYLSLYEANLRDMRYNYKPGLIPPFYADLPKTLEEIMESEKRYLEKYAARPLYTDFQYFIKAFVNIFIKRARSN